MKKIYVKEWMLFQPYERQDEVDMLPDACMNSVLGEEHGRETMKRNARFFTDYFFEKCREKDC